MVMVMAVVVVVAAVAMVVPVCDGEPRGEPPAAVQRTASSDAKKCASHSSSPTSLVAGSLCFAQGTKARASSLFALPNTYLHAP